MIARLGKVLYWAGVFLAGAIALLVVSELTRGSSLYEVGTPAVTAIAIFLAGWGARYVLSNK